MYFDGKFLIWEIIEVKGEIYAPKKASLIGENKIIGLSVLKSCENGMFKINIKKDGSEYTYTILDGKKIISKGKASIRSEKEETIITCGSITGIYTKNSITVQNYGNSMNEYNHFTQCDQKYLPFIKQ